MQNYADPLDPNVTVADYLTLQTFEVGSDTVTWASGTATSPSKPRTTFRLPPIGLASRVFIDVDGGSATAYDFTAGGGTGAVAASGEGPWSIVESIQINVNGSTGFYDVSGFGTYLLMAAEERHAFPQDAPGTVYTTAPTDVASDVFDYPAAADGRPRFGFELPLSLLPGSPLGMVLLGNDQTTMDVVLKWATLDKYAVLAGGGTATLTLTATCTLEYFDVPDQAAFDQFVRPMLGWVHWNVENRKDVTSTGAGANVVTLDNHDTYLQVIHTLFINNILNTDAVERIKFLLNRAHTRYDMNKRTFLRRQRHEVGKDLPAFIWTFFSTASLRDAIRADAYTDVRSQIDIVSGTALGAGAFVRTAEKRLVDLRAGLVG